MKNHPIFLLESVEHKIQRGLLPPGISPPFLNRYFRRGRYWLHRARKSHLLLDARDLTLSGRDPMKDVVAADWSRKRFCRLRLRLSERLRGGSTSGCLVCPPLGHQASRVYQPCLRGVDRFVDSLFH